MWFELKTRFPIRFVCIRSDDSVILLLGCKIIFVSLVLKIMGVANAVAFFSTKCLGDFNKSITFASAINAAGAIAQLVEQRTENPCVPGSIPGGTTDKERVTKVTLSVFVVK